MYKDGAIILAGPPVTINMQHLPEEWGRPRRDHLLPTTANKSSLPITRTQQPIVTGTSVIAIKYADGVMMATDCLASYGSLARFRDMQRMTSLGARTLLGTSGDISDFQYLTRLLHQYHVTEVCLNDGHLMSPKQWYTALAAVLYKRRSESNPLWTANVLAGVEDDGSIFLGSCDLLGTQFQADSIATGYGAHLAQPLLRDAIEIAKARNSPLTEQEAFNVIEKCMKVLYYRDARSLDKIQTAKVTKDGVIISEPYIVESDWSIA